MDLSTHLFTVDVEAAILVGGIKTKAVSANEKVGSKF